MTAGLVTSLREIILDALSDSYYSHRANVEECRACAKHPAGVCFDHQDDERAAQDCERVRKQIEGSLADPDAAEELAALLGDEAASQLETTPGGAMNEGEQ